MNQNQPGRLRAMPPSLMTQRADGELNLAGGVEEEMNDIDLTIGL